MGDSVLMGGQTLVLLLSMEVPGLIFVGGRRYLPQYALTWWCLWQAFLCKGWEGGLGWGGGGERNHHLSEDKTQSPDAEVGYAGRSLLGLRVTCRVSALRFPSLKEGLISQNIWGLSFSLEGGYCYL